MRRFQLTWLQDSRRWRKRYKGKSYYFSMTKGETKLSSYHRCLDAWHAKKSNIDSEDFARSQSHEVWQELLGLTTAARENAQTKGLRGLSVEMDDLVRLTEISIAQQRRYPGATDETGTVGTLSPNVLGVELGGKEGGPAEETVGQAVDAFLQQKQTEVQREKLSAGRFDVIQRCVKHFVAQVGRDAPVSSLKGKTLIKYHASVESKVVANKWRPAYASGYVGAARQFMRWCWATDLLDQLPRNFQDKELRIKVGLQKIKTLTVDEVKCLLAGASGRTKLYLLLILNCGMLQQDIASLRQDEVDWDTGRIKRKRSKTAQYEKVPTVDYQLWPETFRLLKKYRSDDAKVVLLNQNGEKLKTEFLKHGRLKKTDNIRNAYQRLTKRLNISNPSPLKTLRKTCATLIADSAGEELARYYLGHSPRSVADRHYIEPATNKLDQTLGWLGQQFCVDELAKV